MKSKESISSIVSWHEKTFPDATLEKQQEKFCDEFAEFQKCDDAHRDHRLEELADCFIVACGISRFSTDLALLAFATVADYHSAQQDGNLQAAIDRKMAINRRRKWNAQNGKYQHKESWWKKLWRKKESK